MLQGDRPANVDRRHTVRSSASAAYSRSRRWLCAFAALAVGSGASGAAHAQSSNLSGTVGLSSQLVDRGLAITPDTTIAQGAVSWTLPSGWAFGAAASTEVRDATPLAEAFAQASHFWRLTPDWQFEAGLAYYDYPGRGGGAFNRAEGSANWIYRDVLTLGASAIYPTGGTDHALRGAADVDFHWPLPWHVSFAAGAGYAQAQVPYYRVYPNGHGSYGYHGGDRVNSYGYGHLGLIWAQGPWRVEVDRMFVDASLRSENLAASPWVATLSFSF
ncbi:TorF family putative porin [Dyella sp. C11]|uniref:TorF family putative porin n=1 Tax=Dyella sp. C11 TaxID=2126991 RepID=UPI000D659432|nr:TorF family putative porin [Dyella sp. C11]